MLLSTETNMCFVRLVGACLSSTIMITCMACVPNYNNLHFAGESLIRSDIKINYTVVIRYSFYKTYNTKVSKLF